MNDGFAERCRELNAMFALKVDQMKIPLESRESNESIEMNIIEKSQVDEPNDDASEAIREALEYLEIDNKKRRLFNSQSSSYDSQIDSSTSHSENTSLNESTPVTQLINVQPLVVTPKRNQWRASVDTRIPSRRPAAVYQLECSPLRVPSSNYSSKTSTDTRVNLLNDRCFRRVQNYQSWRDTHRSLFPSGLVNLKIPFTADDDIAYSQAVAQPDSAVLFTRFNTPITRQNLSCLFGCAWVTDEILNQYMTLISERSKQYHRRKPQLLCYSHFSFFYNKLAESPKGYCYEEVSRWTTRGARKVDIFDLDILFIPRNVANTHWTLGVVFIKDKRIEYFDSLGSPSDEFLQNILRYLCDESEKKLGISLNKTEWKTVNRRRSTPQQDNGYDCGVFTMVTANYLSMQQDLGFSCADIKYFRKRIAVDVLRGEAAWEPVILS